MSENVSVYACPNFDDKNYEFKADTKTENNGYNGRSVMTDYEKSLNNKCIEIERLQAECDNWHNEYNKAFASYLETFKSLTVLQAENEELKAKCKLYGEINEQDTKDYAKIFNERNKYKQALEEIRGIASPHCSQCIEITKIISEVLEECTK